MTRPSLRTVLVTALLAAGLAGCADGYGGDPAAMQQPIVSDSPNGLDDGAATINKDGINGAPAGLPPAIPSP